MTLEKATSVVIDGSATKDDLTLQYGKIQGSIRANSQYRDIVNTNYITEPVKGGTVKVQRIARAISQAYGTARAAHAANAIKNKFAQVNVDTDREFAEEMSAKDLALWQSQGAGEVLAVRQPEYAAGMTVELDEAYATILNTLAVANGLVDVSDGTELQDKLALLIEAAEAVSSDNVDKIDRSMLVMYLKPEFYDALEKSLTVLPNPITGRTDAKFFRRVEVRPAVRQTGADAIVQMVGAIAQPVVMDPFIIGKPEFSNDQYSYMSYHYGTDGVLPETVLGCTLSTVSA